MTQGVGQKVSFRVCDIYHPRAVTVMELLFADKTIEGELIQIADNDRGEAFALVRVEGLADPVLIAEERLVHLI
jgi:hypothetical protein